MDPTIIESPYAGDVETNLAYAKRALADSLKRDEAPFASHLLYTQVLDDLKPEQRYRGINAGFAWWIGARKVVFYLDLGWSPGMKSALARARVEHKIIEMRYLDGRPEGGDKGFVEDGDIEA